MEITVPVNGMITGSFGVIGTGVMTPTGTTLDASVTAAPVFSPFDGFTGAITEGGSSVAVTALNFSMNNNLAPTYVVGSNTAPSIISGKSDLTGSLTALFENETLLNKFLAETESALSLTLEGANGGDLTILCPRIKYTGASITVSSSDDGLVVEMPFQALRDSSEATNIKLTRVPA